MLEQLVHQQAGGGANPAPSLHSLDELERVIATNQGSYVAVGKALREIQEDKKYQDAGYNTFEEYCDKRWGFARQTGYNYVHASKVFENVRICVQNPPSFSQAREMFGLSESEQRELSEDTDFENTTVDGLKRIIAHRFPQRTECVQKREVEAQERTLEEWLDQEIRRLARQNYGPYLAKFDMYPEQHTTEIGNIEGIVLQIYTEILTICQQKLQKTLG